MGIINRYRLGKLREQQLALKARRTVYQSHPVFEMSPRRMKKANKILAKSLSKEFALGTKQALHEHMYYQGRVHKELAKVKRSMSKREAASVAARARWGNRGGKKR